MTLAERLKLAMENKNISQGKLSKQSGLAQSMIWKLINGKADGTTKIVQLAHALEVSAEWLQSGTGNMEADAAHQAEALPPIQYDGLFAVRLYNSEGPTSMIVMVPDPIKSDYCKAFQLSKDSGCAEVPAGTIIVVDTKERPGQNDLVYVSVGGIHSVYRYVDGGKSGYLSVDDKRVPLIEVDEKTILVGVLVYIMRDIRN